MELKVIKADGDYTHVALCGRLDIDGVTSVEMNFTNVVSAKGKPAIVDMTEVSFIASLGMRMLLSAAKALRATERSLSSTIRSLSCWKRFRLPVLPQ